MTFTTIKRDYTVLAFIEALAVLGNTLWMLSIGLANAGKIDLDLSHIATLIASVYRGPYVEYLIGLLSGLFLGLNFRSMG